jgi:tetratricopeptide (TPR) repeat protein
MASGSNKIDNAAEIDRLALALVKEAGSKAFIPLAEEYGKVGMWDEAAGVLEDGLKVYPSFITAMVALGRVYDQLNQPVKAKAMLEEAIKVSPENLRAHRTLAKIYAAEGAKDAALRSCNVILNMNPQDQEALALRATLGESVAPAKSEAPRSGQATSPAPSITADVSSSGEATPLTASDAEPAMVFSSPPQGDSAPAAIVVTSTADESERAVVAKLEQWLTSINEHRRDRSAQSESNAPTS